MSGNRTSRTAGGFTLIELLVVVAIIALLLAIIVPTLRLAKDHARRIGCSANLRSLAMAAIFYADDNNGLTPSSTNTWNDNGIWRGGWCGVTHDGARQSLDIHTQVYGNGSDEFTGLRKGQLWPYIENTGGWRCPADPDKEQLRSYAMAGQWWGRHYRENTAVWYDPGPQKAYKKISAIKSPGQRFMFVDELGYNIDAYFAIWFSQPKWWNIPTFKHGGGSVNGFADGHVKAYKMESQTIAMARQALENVIDNNNSSGGFRMPQIDVPDSRDLRYYQRATWGKLGW